MSMFALNFKRIRKAKGYSQQSFAKAMKVSRSAVSMWEMGEREPDIDTIMQIAEVLEIPFTDLIGVEWADEEDKEFFEKVSSLPDNRVMLSDRHYGLRDIVKYKGYYMEQYNDGKFSLMTPEGCMYTITEEDIEAVMKAVEKAAVLQLELIAEREHQEAMKGIILMRKSD